MAEDKAEVAEAATAVVTFVTGNKNKLAEVQAITRGVVPMRHQKLDLPELQGEPEEISKEKCRIAARQVSPVHPPR
eukprot:jgi/Chlat1/1325/Chrsp118S08659